MSELSTLAKRRQDQIDEINRQLFVDVVRILEQLGFTFDRERGSARELLAGVYSPTYVSYVSLYFTYRTRTGAINISDSCRKISGYLHDENTHERAHYFGAFSFANLVDKLNQIIDGKEKK